MKIVEYSKGSITEVENVFKVVESGAQGQAGTDGTDGTDGTNGTNGTNGTDGEGVPIGGTAGQQLAKIDGDDFNTEWVDPATGGIYSVVESRPMTGNTDEIFNVGDDDIAFVFDDIILNSNSSIGMKISYDNDASYSLTGHHSWGEQRRENNALLATSSLNANNVFLTRGNNTYFDGLVELFGVTGNKPTKIKIWMVYMSSALVGYWNELAGYMSESTPVTNVKFSSVAINSGYIHHLKRNLP